MSSTTSYATAQSLCEILQDLVSLKELLLTMLQILLVVSLNTY